ncbi:MAG: hypothetical protein ACQJCO_03525 [cyanobacterium endosymbiont of Rhopalodia sterrenbergii]
MAISSKQNLRPLLSQRDPEKYAVLQTKAQIPYKELRQFFHITFNT